MYDIDETNRDDYLDWFHTEHIPEKLSREGYEWAGHYQAQAPASTRYVAFFGGASTRVFFDPSPAQLKQGQDDLTRKMIGMRQNPSAFVFTEEWRAQGPALEQKPGNAIEFLCCNTPGADEDFNAFLAQEDMPAFETAIGSVRGRKLLSVTGPAKHGVLYQFTTAEALNAFQSARPQSDWRHRVESACEPVAGTPMAANRIWPLPA
jgi:hypothetical protein